MNNNGFNRCSGDYCLKLEYWDPAIKCGNDIIDETEHCDGHAVCASNCATPTNLTLPTPALPILTGTGPTELRWTSCTLERGMKA